MPRQPRLDTLGPLHHVMARAVDGGKIFVTTEVDEPGGEDLGRKIKGGGWKVAL